MAQTGPADLSDCYAKRHVNKDPLVEIDALGPWEEFRSTLDRVSRKPDADHKSRAGCPPIDAVLTVAGCSRCPVVAKTIKTEEPKI
ncbi:MAG TPA: hypothetical protein ENH56_04805 [Roseobacter sp.]|jgi:hypothetical protein|uniref:Uncharacterized protein n=2 Tax=root TaxID=1 RepID=A0A221K8S7_9RHOB|nr:hypothetical protein SULPSESMR1_04187 [Pseudosulfitobacter pseudonitzschiae]HDZ80553.1 hypothetical protein [Roseobacter sp.]|tara:strand:+ start:141 stop:398 length:258 start_codon:yes stop_codon:yes gene_type:complete